MIWNEYDENTPEYKYYTDLLLEESVSNKATCRGCFSRIDKGVLRWCSDQVDSVETIYTSKRYYHTQCLPGIAGHPIVEYNPKTKQGKLAQMNSMPTKQVEKELF